MEISEVEDVLNSLRLLGSMSPQHIFITQEKISKKENGRVFYRGLGGLASEETGVIVLSKDADVTTVPHELVHSVGAGELLAEHFGNILALKYELSRRFFILKPLKRRIEYREVEVPEEYKGRIRHYVRT